MMSTVELITADKRQISDWSSGMSAQRKINGTRFNDNSVAVEEGVENNENVDDLDTVSDDGSGYESD